MNKLMYLDPSSAALLDRFFAENKQSFSFGLKSLVRLGMASKWGSIQHLNTEGLAFNEFLETREPVVRKDPAKEKAILRELMVQEVTLAREMHIPKENPEWFTPGGFKKRFGIFEDIPRSMIADYFIEEGFAHRKFGTSIQYKVTRLDRPA